MLLLEYWLPVQSSRTLCQLLPSYHSKLSKHVVKFGGVLVLGMNNIMDNRIWSTSGLC